MKPSALLPAAAALFLLSCSRVAREPGDLGARTTSFDEELSSLSIDPQGRLWIGTETGEVYRYDRHSKNRTRFDFGGSRIYKVVPDLIGGDSVLLVSARNKGLRIFRWPVTGGEPQMLWRYLLPSGNRKVFRYAAYDFFRSGHTLYLATSEGFYRGELPDTIRQPLRLKSVYDGNTCALHDAPVRRLAWSESDSLLLFVSRSGIHALRLGDTVTTQISPRRGDFIGFDGDTLVTLNSKTGDMYRLCGTHTDSMRCDPAANLYYRDTAGGNLWLISGDRIGLRRHAAGPAEYTPVPAGLPVKSPHIIAPGGDGFTYLVTRSALWKVPLNLPAYPSQHKVRAACIHEGTILMTTADNELFRMQPGETGARRVSRLRLDGPVQWIASDDRRIYFTTPRQVYSLRNGWWGFLWNSPRLIPTPRGTDIFCARLVPPARDGAWKLYVGTRDDEGILGYREGADHLERIHPTLYVMSLSHDLREQFDTTYSGPTYATTLNEGIFSSHDFLHKLNYRACEPHSETFDFAESLAAPDGTPFLLTENGIVNLDHSNILPAKGLARIIALNDSTLLGFPRYGIRVFGIGDGAIVSDSLLFPDLEFSPEAVVFLGPDRLLFGTGIGAARVTVGPGNALTIEAWIPFETSVFDLGQFIAITTVILALVAIWWLRRRYLRIGQAGAMRRDIGHLAALKEELNGISLPLVAKIEALEHAAPDDRQSLLTLVSDLFGTLRGELSRQQTELAATGNPEAAALVQDSSLAGENSDLPAMAGAVKDNRRWLGEYDELASMTAQHTEALAGCLEIEGINDGIADELDALALALRKKPMKECRKKYEALSLRLQKIESPASRRLLSEYAKTLARQPEFGNSYFYGRVIRQWLNDTARNSSGTVKEDLEKLQRIHGMAPLYPLLREIADGVVQVAALNHGASGEKQIRDNREATGKMIRSIRETTRRFYETLPPHEAAALRGVCSTDSQRLEFPNRTVVLLLACGAFPGFLKELVEREHSETINPAKSLLRQAIRNLGNPDPESGFSVIAGLLHSSDTGRETRK